MRYYVVADPHGFFTELKTALEERGFFSDSEPRKLIICGDLFDRGSEALALQEFVLDLMAKDQVILIRGNHEDLTLKLLNEWHLRSYNFSHHNTNGTVDTVCQLTHSSSIDLQWNDIVIGKRFLNSPYIQKIIPSMVDYFETEHYIFVHGWIPCTILPRFMRVNEYIFNENWRDSSPEQFAMARWTNGIEAAHYGITELDKTIVCGHWHASFGHANYEGTCSEFGEDADFSPFYAPGIIALDACTAHSRRVNCIVIDD